MTEITKTFLTLATTIVGSGLGTTIVGAWFKRKFDLQLETHKALLMRNSQIHGRQVDALLAIHLRLEQAMGKLQRAVSMGKLAGQPSDQELIQQATCDMSEASKEYSQKKLLMSPVLIQELDEFFKRELLLEITLGTALNPMVPDGKERAALWGEAQQMAFKDLPSVLQAIQTGATAVILG